MPKIPGLQLRGQTYYLRLRVPTDIANDYGKSEVIKTLATKDYSEARKRIGNARAQIESEFDELRLKLKAQKDEPDMLSLYNKYELERLAIRWFHDYKQKKSDVSGGTHPDADADEILAELENDMLTYDAEAKGVSKTAEHHGMTIGGRYLKKLGITYNSKSDAFKTFGQYMSRALAESAKQDLRQWTKKPYAVHDEMFIQGSGNPYQASNLPKKTITELCDEYINDPAAQHRQGTLKNYTVMFRALKEMLGEDTLIRDITRADCKKVRDLLMKLPSNATKKAPGKTLQEAVKLGQKHGWQTLSTKSINNYLGVLATLLNYAKSEGYIHDNPATGLKVKSKKKSKDRYPFDKEQLKTIFSAPLYTGCKDDGHGYNIPGPNIIKRTRFWIPLIALYSGMRLNEICQLETADFVQKNGVDVILVREDSENGDGSKQLKTDASVRFIPIHPELKKIGLLDYIAEIKKGGHTHVWPDIKKDNQGYYSDRFSKWFARFLEQSGAKKSKTSFHSFRHNFRTNIGNAELAYDVAVSLGGWAAQGVQGGYVGKLSPVVLYENISKIKYPELDLSHLYKK